MRQIAAFAFGVLLAGMLLSCASPAPVRPTTAPAPVPRTAAAPSAISAPQHRKLQPGDHIGQMTVEKGALAFPFVAEEGNCLPAFVDTHEPGTQAIECRVPRVAELNLSFALGAKDLATLDANWQALEYQLHVDDREVDVAAFGTEDLEQTIRPGVIIKSRVWSIHLSQPAVGWHTLRWTWTARAPIDDGFSVYAPGTYARVVNFTVDEPSRENGHDFGRRPGAPRPE